MWGVVSVARRGTLGPSASRVARCWRHGGLREVVRRHDSSGCVVSALPERVATTPVAVSTPTRTLYRGPLYPRAVRAIGSSSSESATRRRVDIGQGALIDIDVSAVGIPVQIEAIWDESCFIDVEPTGSSSAANLSITEGRADSPAGTMLSISANSLAPAADEDAQVLRVAVPQLGNLRVRAAGDVTVLGTIEGDVDIVSSNGSVSVRTVRGDRVGLMAAHGGVTVTSAVEGNLKVRAAKFNAKRLHGADVDVVAGAGGIEVHAIYSPSSSFSSEGQVSLGTVDGSCRVRGCATRPIMLRGVSGCVDIDGGSSVDVHFDSAGRQSHVSTASNAPIRLSFLPPADTRVQVPSSIAVDVLLGQAKGSVTESSEEISGVVQQQHDIRLEGGKDSMPFGGQAPSAGQGKISDTGRRMASGEQNEAMPVISVDSGESVTIEALDWIGMMRKKLGDSASAVMK